MDSLQGHQSHNRILPSTRALCLCEYYVIRQSGDEMKPRFPSLLCLLSLSLSACTQARKSALETFVENIPHGGKRADLAKRIEELLREVSQRPAERLRRPAVLRCKVNNKKSSSFTFVTVCSEDGAKYLERDVHYFNGRKLRFNRAKQPLRVALHLSSIFECYGLQLHAEGQPGRMTCLWKGRGKMICQIRSGSKCTIWRGYHCAKTRAAARPKP